MILDEIKDLIKDFELVLIKDLRFKKDANFKNQVKMIYNCENNLNKNFSIPIFSQPSIDITPFVISNLSALGKSDELIKKDSIDSIDREKHEIEIEDLKLSIKKLLEQIDILNESSKTITANPKYDPEIKSEIEKIRKLLAK